MSRTSGLGAAVLTLLSCVALAAPTAGEKDGAPPEFVILHDVDPTIRYDIVTSDGTTSSVTAPPPTNNHPRIPA